MEGANGSIAAARPKSARQALPLGIMSTLNCKGHLITQLLDLEPRNTHPFQIAMDDAGQPAMEIVDA